MKEGYAWEVHMARIYLREARTAKWRQWRFTLLQFAANRRKKALELLDVKPQPGQISLF